MSTPCDRTFDDQFLQGSKFTITFARIPGVSYFCSSVNIPSLSMNGSTFATPFRNYPVAGNKVDYHPLVIVFKVPSDLKPFIELKAWMDGLGKTDGFKSYQNMLKNVDHSPYSDATLTVNDNLNTENFRIIYHNCVPVELGEITMDIHATAEDVISCTAQFAMSHYSIEKV